MKPSHHPLFILLSILLTIYLTNASSISIPNPHPYLLLPSQSLQIPLLPIASSPYISFNITNTSSNVQVINPVQSTSTITFTSGPQETTASFISSSYIALIDQSFNLFYGDYQQDSTTIKLNTTAIPVQNGSQCTSITSLREFLMIACGVVETPTSNQTQVLYVFNMNNQTFLNISQELPYSNLDTPLPGIIVSAETSTGPIVTLYFQKSSLKGQEPVIVMFDIDTMTSNVTIISGIAIQSVEATYYGLYLIDTSGDVYHGAYAANLSIQPLENVISLQDNIIGSCKDFADILNPSLVFFSSSSLYQMKNSKVMVSYPIPSNSIPVTCRVDTEFLSVIVSNSSNTTALNSIVYLLNNENNGYPLAQLDITLNNQSIMTSGQASGQVLILTGNTLTLTQVSRPVIQVSNAQESLVINLTVNSLETSVQINVTALPSPSQIYQKFPTFPSISSFGVSPIVKLQSLFVGPGLGVVTSESKTFNGLYGNCVITNSTSFIPSAYDGVSIQISPSQAYSSGDDIIPGTIIYTQDTDVYYQNVTITSLYSAGTWNSPQTCNSTFQAVSNATKISLDISQKKCLFGQNYTLCLLSNNSLAHITPNGTTVYLPAQYVCQDIYLWQESAYNLDISVCLSSESLTFFNIEGNLISTVSSTSVGVENFTMSISTHPQFPELVVASYPEGVIGVQVFLAMIQSPDNLSPNVVFRLNVSYSQDSHIQLASNRLVIVDFNSSIIAEWDILNVYNPYFLGTYELYSFQLNSTVSPTYLPTPNHLILYATNDSTPYLIVLQPGNMATSTLLYVQSLENVPASTITPHYDPINQYTIFFMGNASNISYFYAQNASYISLTNNADTSTCFYCSGTSSLQVFSSAIPSAEVNISVPYTVIASEPVPQASSVPQLIIKTGAPVQTIPSYFFEGTVLDYNITTVTVDANTAVYLTTPLNLTQSLQKAVTVSNGGAISLFSDGNKLYILYQNGLSYIDLKTSSYQIQDLTLVTPPNNVNFVAGDASSQGTIAIAYTNGTNWGIYNYSSGTQYTIPTPIIKVKVVGNLIFVLTGEAQNLVYVLESTTSGITPVMTVRSSLFSLIPTDFEVVNLEGNSYVILIVDGTDSLFNFLVNTTSTSSMQSVLYNFTQNVKSDMPASLLEIIGVQQGPPLQNSSLNFVLSVTNFHSYLVQLTYSQTSGAQFSSVLDCFVQMPEHVTLDSFLTDTYFLDIKQSGNLYYLYNYPLNFTYPGNSGQPESYNYIQPIHRQSLAGSNNIGLYGVDGASGVAFAVDVQGGSSVNMLEIMGRLLEMESTPSSFTVGVQAYTVTCLLEIGFVSSLSSSTLSNINVDKITLTGGNDNGSSEVMVGLDTPINILNSAYFIAFTCIFTIIFCAACIWFFRRAYKKRKMRIQETKESYHVSDPAVPVEEILVIPAEVKI